MKNTNITIKGLFLLFTSFSFLFVACNSGEEKSDTTTEARIEKSVKDITSPCEIITLNDIKEYFKIQDTTEVNVENKEVTFPSCSYEWGKDVVMDKITVANQTIEYGAPAKVMIVMAKGVPSSGFEQSTAVYKDGEEISGIGEKAIWGAKMSQITFLYNDTLFHVNVKASSDKQKNKNDAIALSKLILKRI